MADPSPIDVAGLFTPEQNSAALIYLKNLIGCPVFAVWKGQQCSANSTTDILASLVAILNWAMLVVMAAVATYLIFMGIKDTANDGEVGGRSTNSSWTMVLAAIAAILCVPLASGFSPLQYGMLQTTVWGVGLGDKMWNAAADKMLSASSAETALKSYADGSWFSATGTEAQLRQQVAAALGSRVAGSLCARDLSAALKTMATADPTITAEPGQAVPRGGTSTMTLSYKSGAALSGASGACGSVIATFNNGSDASVDTSAGTRDAVSAAMQQISGEVSAKVASSLLQQIDQQANSLRDSILPADGAVQLAGAPDKISTAVDTIMTSAANSVQQAMGQLPQRLQGPISQSLADAKSRGWIYAVLYQRVIVNATYATTGIVSGVNVSAVQPEADMAAVLGCRRSGSWNYLNPACTTAQEIYFADYDRRKGELDQLNGAFLAAGQQTTATGTNSAQLPGLATTTGMVSGAIQWIMRRITPSPLDGAGGGQADTWIDPIPAIQGNGSVMLGTGAVIAGVGTVGQIAGEATAKVGLGAVVSALGGFAIYIGLAMMALGFVLAVVVPYMPLLYYFLAGLSWLIQVTKAIIVAPFLLFQAFYPHRQPGIAGTAFGKMAMIVLGLLIRPGLIVIGLVFCMVAMRVGMDLLNALYANAYAAIASPGAGGALNPANLAMLLGGFLLYSAAIVMLVAVCCSLIQSVGDFVMEQVEHGASRVFAVGAGAQQADPALGSPGARVGGMIGMSRAYNAGRLADKLRGRLPLLGSPKDGAPK